MVNYYKMYTVITYVFMATMYSYADQISQSDRFDVMADFAYPMLEVESMRHDVAQGLHFLQSAVCLNGDCHRALHFLEQADSKPVTRDGMNQDDRDTLQNLLNQINGLIDSLEERNEYRSDLSNICLSLQEKL